MLLSPRANSSPTVFEIVLKIGIVFGIAWFLVSNMLTRWSARGQSSELKAAVSALNSNKIAEAGSRFDRFLREHPGNLIAYQEVIDLCGAEHQPELVTAYMQRAVAECRTASKAERADLYRHVAGAYLECGAACCAAQAQQAAQQAYQLDPNTIDAMNSMAYTLAETSKDPVELSRAEKLILEALGKLNSQAGTPDAATLSLLYRDTYGWVLYKEGLYGPKALAQDRFDRAADVLADVVNAAPDELGGVTLNSLYYHLGAALSQSGRPNEARKALLVALLYDPKNEAAQRELAALPPAAAPATGAAGEKPFPAATAPAGKAVQAAGSPAFTPLAPADGNPTRK